MRDYTIEALAIAKTTGTRETAVLNFINTNNLDAKKVLKLVAKGSFSDRFYFLEAFTGQEQNKTRQKFIKELKAVATA